MHLLLQEHPLATQVILDKDDINTLYEAISRERTEENRWAMIYYGMPYEYEQTIEEEVRSIISHLKGIAVDLLCRNRPNFAYCRSP